MGRPKLSDPHTLSPREAQIAELLNISVNWASTLKSRGVFDGAIRQVGNVMVIDVDKAIECIPAIREAKKRERDALRPTNDNNPTNPTNQQK